MRIRKTIFGRIKAQPNTFIGGVGTTITSAAALAAKIGISSTRVKNFKIIGVNIETNITGTYSIPQGAFKGSEITYFNDFEGNVVDIKSAAFYNCTSLTSINFPSCTVIGGNQFANNAVFYNCRSLSTVNLPSWTGHTTGVVNTFFNCLSLTEVNFPSYNGVIGAYMFYGCSSLTSVNLSITGFVGNYAFVGTKITSINLTNATLIGPSAFAGVTTLNIGINMPFGTTLGSGAFSNSGITSFNSNCTFIDKGAFLNCASLVYVDIPECTTITSSIFGEGVFKNCTSILTINAPNLTTINNTNTFSNCSSIETIYMPLLTALGSTLGNDSSFNYIKLGATITVAASLATVNTGSPDGDLVYASGTRGATIIYI